MIEFKMPSLGADMEAGILREWLVKPGDFVKRGDIIAEVETQKGLIEIEVFDNGKIENLLIKIDEKVPVGTIMAMINPDGETTIKSSMTPDMSVAESATEISPVVEKRRIRITPLARKIADENKIDYSVIKGSGEGGFIVKEDIEQLIKKQPSTDEVKTEVAKIRTAIAAAMSRSNEEIPHYYLTMKIDMSESLSWLSEKNKQRSVQKRILHAALLIKAVANSLKEVPEFNASWENGLKLKNEIHPGMVVALRTGGIVIPAIHNADKKSVEDVMETLSDLITRSKNEKLKSSELADSTISITLMSEGGAESVYGMIYPPQVALVGFGSINEEPWAENGMLAVRPVITVTLAADHRATDGHTGSYFLKTLRSQLLNPDKI